MVFGDPMHEEMCIELRYEPGYTSDRISSGFNNRTSVDCKRERQSVMLVAHLR